MLTLEQLIAAIDKRRFLEDLRVIVISGNYDAGYWWVYDGQVERCCPLTLALRRQMLAICETIRWRGEVRWLIQNPVRRYIAARKIIATFLKNDWISEFVFAIDCDNITLVYQLIQEALATCGETSQNSSPAASSSPA